MVKEELTRQNIEWNENESIMYQNVCDAPKVLL